MRLFIAASLATEQMQVLEEAQGLLRCKSKKLSLTKAENLHLTLHFLGETEASDCERLLLALAEVELPPLERLPSRLRAYDYFKRRDGLLVFADLEVSTELLGLRENLGELLREQGFEVDRRPWKTHVTLARRTQLASPWQEVKEQLPLAETSANFTNIVLFKSEFTQHGMLYTPLYKFFR